MTTVKIHGTVPAYINVDISNKLEPGKQYTNEELYEIAESLFEENRRLYKVETNELSFPVWNPKDFDVGIEFDIT